jgi:folate-binding protein YgfZ
MNSGQTFLQHLVEQSGAKIMAENQLHFPTEPADYPKLQQQNTITPLTHLGLVSLKGPDAKKFLQGQVTCDVQQIHTEKSMVGARCDPKGRALANFQLLHQDDDTLLMVMDSSLVSLIIDDLAKYAAFFDVTLEDVSTQFVMFGFAGPERLCPPKLCPTELGCYLIWGNRQILIVPDDQAQSLWSTLSGHYNVAGTEYWQLLNINTGLGLVQADTSGLFIPQMLNLQAIGGISFTKGCYTGQEVIARMKYLGKLKRRMYRVTQPTGAHLPTPGTPCYLPGETQNSGHVVLAANADNAHQNLLLVLTAEAAQSDQLIISGVDEESIAVSSKFCILPLPYEIES